MGSRGTTLINLIKNQGHKIMHALSLQQSLRIEGKTQGNYNVQPLLDKLAEVGVQIDSTGKFTDEIGALLHNENVVVRIYYSGTIAFNQVGFLRLTNPAYEIIVGETSFEGEP